MSSIRLRDYQVEALNSVIKEFECGISKQLIALPTSFISGTQNLVDLFLRHSVNQK